MAPADKTPAPAAAAAAPRTEPNAVFGRAMVGVTQPACAETLPAVMHTLRGIVQATETAAQKVLDETDKLTRHRQQLGAALNTLRPMMVYADPGMRTAWNTARQAWEDMAGSALGVVSAMEFQDLTAQHLNAAIDAVTALREKLAGCLATINIQIESDGAPVRLAETLGAPATRSVWKQELADQLLDDSRRSAVPDPAP